MQTNVRLLDRLPAPSQPTGSLEYHIGPMSTPICGPTVFALAGCFTPFTVSGQ